MGTMSVRVSCRLLPVLTVAVLALIGCSSSSSSGLVAASPVTQARTNLAQSQSTTAAPTRLAPATSTLGRSAPPHPANVTRSSPTAPRPRAADLATLRDSLRSVLVGARRVHIESRVASAALSDLVLVDQELGVDGHVTATQQSRQDGTGADAYATSEDWIWIDSKCFVAGAALLKPTGLKAEVDEVGSPLFQLLPADASPASLGLDKQVCAPEVFATRTGMAALAAACTNATKGVEVDGGYKADVKRDAILELLMLKPATVEKFAPGDLTADILVEGPSYLKISTELTYQSEPPRRVRRHDFDRNHATSEAGF